MKTADEIRKDLFDLPDIFMHHYKRKEYAQAYRSYETAITIANFIGITEEDKERLFGNRENTENPIMGKFIEDTVLKCQWEAIKARESYDCRRCKEYLARQ